MSCQFVFAETLGRYVGDFMWCYVCWNTFHRVNYIWVIWSNFFWPHMLLSSMKWVWDVWKCQPLAARSSHFKSLHDLHPLAKCLLVVLIPSKVLHGFLQVLHDLWFKAPAHAPGHGYGWWPVSFPTSGRPRPHQWLQTLCCLCFGRGNKARVARNTSVHASRMKTPLGFHYYTCHEE
jgi:hypothetical protein